MSKHTHGEWTLDIVQVGKEWLKGRLTEAVVCGDEVVAICAENQANARLIAAAPDLLQAVRTFADWLRREEEGFDHTKDDRNTPEGEAAWRAWYDGNLNVCALAREQARAAIAKAEGES